MFPEELPRRLLRMFTFVGDTVLDPFLGSGTTSLAAKNLLRNSIGYEINPDFLTIIQKKLGLQSKTLFSDNVSFEITVRPPDDHDFKEDIQSLPYIFRDPVRFDKKVDPRQLNFGSKINGKEGTKRYYTLKRILSPNTIELNTGLIVKLLGVNPIPEKSTEAIQFLQDILRGEHVFLKFDETKYDSDGHLLCYLFLKKKTFINANLIKRGLARPDDKLEYRFRSKFLREQGLNQKTTPDEA